MTNARMRRRALYAGGGVGGALLTGAAGLYGLLWGEAKLAERRIPTAADPAPLTDDTTWAAQGVEEGGKPITLAMIGDSTAAGYGAGRERDTPGVQIAIAVSEAAGRPVHLRSVAVIGAEQSDLAGQVDTVLGRTPELAVLMIGANDVTSRLSPSAAVPHLAAATARLRAAGTQVVVGTCPDLGTIRPLAQPLRAYARWGSRRMARAQTVAVVGAGGRTVSLGDLLGPLFMTNPDFFAEDRFHPSAAGYAVAAAAVVPSCLDALGLPTRARAASPLATRRVKNVHKAAAQAVAHPGTEVSAARRFGRAVGLRGPLARLRRRRADDAPVASPETATQVGRHASAR